MSIQRMHIAFMLVVPALLFAGMSHADSGQVPEERPTLENYDDPDRFITDVLAWEKHQRQNKTQKKQKSQKGHTSSEPEDWHDITGPETLEGALRKARGYTPPDYKAQYRFNRTTHLSFPLPRLEGEQMSGQAITGGLREQTLEQRSLEPLPEMRMILEEAGDEEKFSTPEGRPFLPVSAETHRQTVQVNTR